MKTRRYCNKKYNTHLISLSKLMTSQQLWSRHLSQMIISSLILQGNRYPLSVWIVISLPELRQQPLIHTKEVKSVWLYNNYPMMKYKSCKEESLSLTKLYTSFSLTIQRAFVCDHTVIFTSNRLMVHHWSHIAYILFIFLPFFISRWTIYFFPSPRERVMASFKIHHRFQERGYDQL
jgi:hypothetical protein